MGRRAMWLDDLYIDPAFRSKGIGKALMAHLAGIAVRNDWRAPGVDRAGLEHAGDRVLQGAGR